MRFLTLTQFAFRSLRRSLTRSTLAALGIVIGVSALITMVSIGSGAKARVIEALSRPEAQLLTLSAIPSDPDWISSGRVFPRREGLSLQDFDAIRVEIPEISDISAMNDLSEANVQANGRESSAPVSGSDTSMLTLLNRKIVDGMPFDADDLQRSTSVCLLTASVAQELFEDEPAIGRIVRINGVPFNVRGVLADLPPQPNIPAQFARDLRVFVPLTSMWLRLDRDAHLSFFLKIRDDADLANAQLHLGDLMERRRGNRTAQFRTYSSADAIQARTKGTETMSRLLAAIAGVSLLVGGIGIMNIMLANIAERTPEIGLRMAIGTRSRHIRRQVLLEAVILSLLGGIVGVLCGIGVSWQVSKMNNWPILINFTSILLAVIYSSAIGISFGYYPALRASRLDPIAALRAD